MHSSPQISGSLAILCDGPPTLAHPAGIIVNKFLDALGPQVCGIYTRQYRRSISLADIKQASGGTPLHLYPDSTNYIPRRFVPDISSLADASLFRLGMRKLNKFSQHIGTKRIFAICGGDPWFCSNIMALINAGYEVDVYLLDDLHESARKSSSWLTRTIASNFILPMLNKANHIYGISTGFCEHLNQFGLESSWLPLPGGTTPPKYSPFSAAQHDVREIAFIGSINFLYDQSLRDFYELIERWNAQPNNFKIVLRLWPLADPSRFLDSLPNSKYIRVSKSIPESELIDELKRCWACLLPYNFQAEARAMVRTSFSSKLLAYYGSGRPIIGYGPKETSISRYFVDNHLPLSFTDKTSLNSVFLDIANADRPSLIETYRATWIKHHSPQAIRSALHLNH